MQMSRNGQQHSGISVKTWLPVTPLKNLDVENDDSRVHTLKHNPPLEENKEYFMQRDFMSCHFGIVQNM
jgi:hypothetical protein